MSYREKLKQPIYVREKDCLNLQAKQFPLASKRDIIIIKVHLKPLRRTIKADVSLYTLYKPLTVYARDTLTARGRRLVFFHFHPRYTTLNNGYFLSSLCPSVAKCPSRGN